MKEDEREVLRMKQRCISDAISKPTEIADILFQRGNVTEFQIEDLYDSNLSTVGKCQHLLHMISEDNSRCSLYDFVEVLKQSGEWLAGLAKDIEETANSYGVPIVKMEPEAIVYEKVRKINVYTNARKRVEALGHTLKRLSRDGDVQSFKRYVNRIYRIYKKKQKAIDTDIAKRMQIADLYFTCLEAEVIMMRVFYDESLYKHDIFKEIEKVIPFTSNPTVTSMTFLARYGSSRSMNEGIETGLSILQFSKQHAENIVPCRDSGMVYYIEINLLFQIYEREPTDSLKERILKTAELAISQFVDEPESIRNDYKRMLLLKMVFCRLGIGLFGNRIEGTVVTGRDLHVAKNYLDFIEFPEIWEGMEARRKMLFNLAKAEYFKHQGQSDMAIMYATEAHKLATEKQWKAELPPIKLLLCELESEMELKKMNENKSGDIDLIEGELERLETKIYCRKTVTDWKDK